MKICFSTDAWADYLALLDADQKLLRKVNRRIAECMRHPFTGSGKPEPLRGNLKGWWSWRIDQEHRLVYRVTSPSENPALEIIQCRYHY